MRRTVSALSILLIGMISVAHSAQPLDSLKRSMDQGIVILKDPRYQDATDKELQREKMWETIQKIFDFTEIAKRTLARNWRNFTPQQRQEFTDRFAELLKNTYLNRIQGKFEDEKVIYLSQDMITDSKALVKTKLLRKNKEIPIDYSMRLRNDTWRIYDVRVEGVSMVKNYRTQFNKILLNGSPAKLIERLKEKLELLKQAKEEKIS
ncbi:MAG: hypothetical protein BA861_08605 [Desulfobacterales bacterium S3730MH5]|nr:MAG: hypothetical protein BA861_08605 [Desulfobacterales bacterium S3730MH5]OEU84940.1 MAG: hypothetical protein BA865_07410 [Desulfobacterales bacterium S5133MH4]